MLIKPAYSRDNARTLAKSLNGKVMDLAARQPTILTLNGKVKNNKPQHKINKLRYVVIY